MKQMDSLTRRFWAASLLTAAVIAGGCSGATPTTSSPQAPLAPGTTSTVGSPALPPSDISDLAGQHFENPFSSNGNYEMTTNETGALWAELPDGSGWLTLQLPDVSLEVNGSGEVDLILSAYIDLYTGDVIPNALVVYRRSALSDVWEIYLNLEVNPPGFEYPPETFIHQWEIAVVNLQETAPVFSGRFQFLNLDYEPAQEGVFVCTGTGQAQTCETAPDG